MTPPWRSDELAVRSTRVDIFFEDKREEEWYQTEPGDMDAD
jgi:hypothetical protein